MNKTRVFFMNIRYSLAFLTIVTMTQLIQATTFKIVDCINPTIPSSANKPKVGI